MNMYANLHLLHIVIAEFPAVLAQCYRQLGSVGTDGNCRKLRKQLKTAGKCMTATHFLHISKIVFQVWLTQVW